MCFGREKEGKRERIPAPEQQERNMCFETTEREREGKRDLLKMFREKRERNKEKTREKTCYVGEYG